MKAIFITGGGSGIGRATAKLFADRGWFVGLADINEAGLAETAAMLPADRSSTHRMDVRDRDQWQVALDDFARASGGRLDILFNNAGIAAGGQFDVSDPADSDRLIDINLKGVINGAHAGLPLLKQTPGSCMLNTCSAAGLYGGPGLAVYAASKFGVRGFTEALDIEWRPFGIKVRSIMPSFIDTPLLDAVTAGSNGTARENVAAAGLEFTPVEDVAQAAWDAVQGDRVHTVVGKTAKSMAFAARWMPGVLRKQLGTRLGRK
ncbi:SDR family oxidoreductase [Sphingomonas colocasiae]|uniref:SDR family oxidoreductase n=1 Tax=Sphingomonas colocasiae TaxID=1848973 RepID=A0ABS7PVV9_9SPHN|nr:SDR family oxidoreductase [Sphingomonas colocasiae]MBY8825418.1 SDR family oxidoreductase [Sphingomonas colocasiae]